jgi:hypothetical protein
VKIAALLFAGVVCTAFLGVQTLNLACILFGGPGCGYEAVTRRRASLDLPPLPDWRQPDELSEWEPGQ